MADWKVERGPKSCAVTERAFEEGEVYYSALADTPEGLKRCDYSLDAWPEVDKSEFLAFWRTRLPVAGEEPRRRLVDTEVIHTLFTRLADSEEPEKITFRYLLGLILTRKRVLRLDDIVKEEDAEYLAVFDRRTKEDLRILNPDADAETLNAAQLELSAIFDMDFSEMDSEDDSAAADLDDALDMEVDGEEEDAEEDEDDLDDEEDDDEEDFGDEEEDDDEDGEDDDDLDDEDEDDDCDGEDDEEKD